MKNSDPRHYDIIVAPVVTEKATMASESWTDPASLPSRVLTFNSISRALLLDRR